MAETAARQLATALSRVLTGYLEGKTKPQGVARQLRRIADWIDGGCEKQEAPKVSEEVREVFRYWLEATGRNAKQTKLTAERRAHVTARLREGYTVATIKRAIDVVARSDWHQGANDRAQRYDDLVTICRNGSRLEGYAGQGEKQADAPTGDEIADLERAAGIALSKGDLDAYNRTNETIRRLRDGD